MRALPDDDKDVEVDLQTKTCSFMVFDLTKLPCVHSLVDMCSRSIDLYTLCSRLEQVLDQYFKLLPKCKLYLFHNYIFLLDFIWLMHG